MSPVRRSEMLIVILLSHISSKQTVESVEPEEDVSLEGFTSCNVRTQYCFYPRLVDNVYYQTQATRTTAFYNSPAFLEVANQSAPFLNSLPQYLDGRSVSLVNMVSIRH